MMNNDFQLLLAQDSATGVLGVPGTADSAAAGSGGATGSEGVPAGGGGFMNLLMIGMVAFLVLMIFTSMSASKKEKKQRDKMLNGLRVRDKIQTTGGMIGTVMEVRENEIVLRVDDATNTRVRFARAAVAHVLQPSKAPADTSSESESESAEKPAEVAV